MKTWIVLFGDGSIMPTRHKPESNLYANGARFFEVDDNETLNTIQDWMSRGFTDKAFREIEAFMK